MAAMILHVLDVVVQKQVEARPVTVAHARREANLVHQELGRIKDAGTLREELIPRGAVWLQIG